MAPERPHLNVVGSVNLDLVARVERLPRPGETVGGAALDRIPGGKGANQAVAAARLGASVRLAGAVGDDEFAEEALAGLRQAGVDLDVERGGATGVALIGRLATGRVVDRLNRRLVASATLVVQMAGLAAIEREAAGSPHGVMFALTRNRLVGSYTALSWRRRP